MSGSSCVGLHPYGPCAPGEGCNRIDRYQQIADERVRQDAKFGELRDYEDGTGGPGSAEAAELLRAVCKAGDTDGDTWAKILAEEVAEAFAETDPAALRKELVQVAAVAVAWIEGLDRRVAGVASVAPNR
jgi:hypothetical protein